MTVMTGIKKWLKDLRKASKPAYQSGWVGAAATAIEHVTEDTNLLRTTEKDTRIEKKPAEVVNEVVEETPVISLKDLDKQIKTVERRIKVFMEQGCNCSDEQLALKFLKARKLFEKYGKKFNWLVTTDAKIKELCSKYKLRLASFTGYSKNVPMEAVVEVEKYVAAYGLVAKDKPLLQLIIDDGGKETKKDPILIASSPFGRWHHVLGAWDSEVQYIDAIIYQGK